MSAENAMDYLARENARITKECASLYSAIIEEEKVGDILRDAVAAFRALRPSQAESAERQALERLVAALENPSGHEGLLDALSLARNVLRKEAA